MRAEQHQDSKYLLQNQPINDYMKKEKTPTCAVMWNAPHVLFQHGDELIQFIVWIIPNLSLFLISKLT